MNLFIEKREPVMAMKWEGFSSMPLLIEMKGDATNILLRHDGSILIFDNAYSLSNYITVHVGNWILKENGTWKSMKEAEFFKTYDKLDD